MYIDKQLEFSDGQSLTASAASTNVVDLGAAGDLGTGEPMAVVVQLDADIGGADTTLDVKVQKDTVENFASAEDVIAGPQIGAGAKAGRQVVLPIPPGELDQRYARVYYTLGGTSPSATVSAFLVPMSFVEKWKSYPDAL